jgi:2-dehydropantoate 2-reductase
MADTTAVIGAGALGTVIAAALHEAGRPVVLCARTRPDELRIDSTATGTSRRVELPIVTDPRDLGPVGWVVLTTKSQDTAGAKPWLTHLVDAGTTVLPVQNGVSHHERLAGLVPPEGVLPAIAYISAERIAPGHVVHLAGKQLIVPAGPRAAGTGELFEPTEINLRADPDFVTVLWRKLMSNVAANAITALTMRRMDVFDLPEVRELALGLLRETVAVGVAAGAELGESDVDEVLTMYGRLPRDNGSSMLYDRLAGRRLEHEYLTGAVVAGATEHGIAVPLNRAVLALLRGLDGSEERA